MNTPRSSLSSSSSVSYLEVAEKAAALEQLYRENNVSIPSGADLAKHIQDSKRTAELWRAGRQNEISARALYHGVQMIRISDAFACVEQTVTRVRYLQDLLSGSLDVFDRVQSKAKDILWEMDLCTLLQEHRIDAHLAEPDIVMNILDSTVGIACKKIYSHAGVRKVLSKAVSQIESTHGSGFFAINIEELAEKNIIRVAANQAALQSAYNTDNLRFLGLHERFFRRYLQSGRSLLALIASGGIAYIGDTPHTARQFTVWAIPSNDERRTSLLDSIQQHLTP